MKKPIKRVSKNISKIEFKKEISLLTAGFDRKATTFFNSISDLNNRVTDAERRLREANEGVKAITALSNRIGSLLEVLAHPSYSVRYQDKGGKMQVLPIRAVASFAGEVLLTVDVKGVN